MDNQLKLELIEKILQVNEDRVLYEVRAVLEQTENESKISDELLVELEKRRKSYLSGNSKTHSWEEVKKELLSK
ncbi:MAG TPA: addiction module protein [Algoriphagus sp.]|jgi:hypothetical protein|nr:addiction module protein [Algoriphagus sp.]